MKVYISKGNTKLGAVLNISLPPILTCGKDVPCKKDCYAMKAWRQYPATRIAWRGNLDAYKESGDDYFDAIVNELRKSKIKLVRWHVAGEIPDANYLAGMMRVAEQLPNKKFLAFTKKYRLIGDAEYYWYSPPTNLAIVLSAWPGYFMPEGLMRRYVVAWMRDAENPDDRIPTDALACPGNCETCMACWKLKAGQSVVFDKH
jgi:hypothetical protein